MDVKVTKDKVIITAPLNQELEVSKSGKSLILCSSGGFSKTATQYKGKQVSLNLVVCIPNK